MKKITAALVRQWLPRRAKDAHKGTCGRVLILAGSKGMVGAGILCAHGAMRSGAGLVRLTTVVSQQIVAAKRVPLEVMTQGLPEDRNGFLSDASWPVIQKTIRTYRPDVMALGPGLGQAPAVRKIVQRIIRTTTMPLVLDADGLNAVLPSDLAERKRPVIITPHEGELGRFLKVNPRVIHANREKWVRFASERSGAICLLKGTATLISDGTQVWKNTTGTPAMASGGMGDVLTGVIAALWGQSTERGFRDGLFAACAAAYVHGAAGEKAARRSGLSVLASDVAQKLPDIFWNLTTSRRK